MLREKTVGASLCIRAVRKVASELRWRKYQVVIDGIPRYGIMSAQNFCEFRWYHGIFRPEAVIGFGAFFLCSICRIYMGKEWSKSEKRAYKGL